MLPILLHHVIEAEAVTELISLACFEVLTTLLDDELQLVGDLDRASNNALLHFPMRAQSRVFVPSALEDLHERRLCDEHLASLVDVLQILQVRQHLFFFSSHTVPFDQLELSLLECLVLDLLTPFFDLLLSLYFLEGVDTLKLAQLHRLLIDTLAHLLLLFDLLQLLHEVVVLPRLRNQF